MDTSLWVLIKKKICLTRAMCDISGLNQDSISNMYGDVE